MVSFAEKRRHARDEVLSAALFVGAGRTAFALDLSRGGARMGLLDDWRPPVESQVTISFLSDTDQAVDLQCRVTRVAVDHVGVAFQGGQDDPIQRLLEAARA